MEVPGPTPPRRCALSGEAGRERGLTRRRDAFCEEHGFLGWIGTSAKTDVNIKKGVSFLVDKILENSGPGAGVDAAEDSGSSFLPSASDSDPAPAAGGCCS